MTVIEEIRSVNLFRLHFFIVISTLSLLPICLHAQLASKIDGQATDCAGPLGALVPECAAAHASPDVSPDPALGRPTVY